MGDGGGKGRTVAGAVDGDLLALDGLGAGAGFQDLLLESHLPVLRVSSPKFGGGAALAWWLLIGGGAGASVT